MLCSCCFILCLGLKVDLLCSISELMFKLLVLYRVRRLLVVLKGKGIDVCRLVVCVLVVLKFLFFMMKLLLIL